MCFDLNDASQITGSSLSETAKARREAERDMRKAGVFDREDSRLAKAIDLISEFSTEETQQSTT